MITILYFSGTGNTWMMAKRIEESLNVAGKSVQCLSIENEKVDEKFIKEVVSTSEQLILGYPIYGSMAPKPMEKFIENLPVVDHTLRVSVFCTQAYMSGDGANYLEALLKSKNMDLIQTQEFNLSNNFYVPVFIRALPVGSEEKVAMRRDKAFKKCEPFVEAIIKGEKRVKSVNGLQKYVGNTQRKHMETYIRKVNDGLYANDSCTKCGLCEKLCPVQNINVKEKVDFSSHCIACMRCYQSCPVTAIQITEKSEDLKKYPRYKGPVPDFKFSWVKD